MSTIFFYMSALLKLRVHPISQAVGRRPFTTETRFRAQIIPRGLRDGQNSGGRLFVRPDLLRFPPVSGVPTIFTTRTELIECRCCMVLATESAVRPPPSSLYLSLLYNSEHFFDILSHPKPLSFVSKYGNLALNISFSSHVGLLTSMS